MLRLMKFLKGERIDILHTHLFEPSVIGLIAGRCARAGRLVMTRHYSDYHTRINKRWHVRLDRLCTLLCDRVIAVSKHTADHMIKEEGASPEKIRVVLNGIDFDRVRTSSAARARLRREFSSDGSFLMLAVARLHPEKGYEYLFRALPEIQRRALRSVRLLVAGEGPFKEAYKDMVRGLGCERSVLFLGFRRDAPDLMAAADLLVLPSLAEAFGLVLAEALYLGTPVVATRVGGIPEIVDDGLDGVLVPPADASALAEAIVELINNPQKLARLGGAGREKVIRRFRFEEMVRNYEAIYQELMTETSKREIRHAARLSRDTNL
jgi:glycosyltransferase involved in cell wall biosynthesis